MLCVDRLEVYFCIGYFFHGILHSQDYLSVQYIASYKVVQRVPISDRSEPDSIQ